MAALSREISRINAANKNLEIQRNEDLLNLKRELIDAIKAWQCGSQITGLRDGFDEIGQRSATDIQMRKKEQKEISTRVQRLKEATTNLRTAAETDRTDQGTIRSLYFSALRSRAQNIEAAHTNTFRWIFDDPEQRAEALRFQH